MQVRTTPMIVVAIALLTAACSSSDGGSAPTTTVSATASSSTTSTAPTTTTPPTTPPTTESESTTSTTEPSITPQRGIDAALRIEGDAPVHGTLAPGGWDSVAKAFAAFADERDVGAATIAVTLDGSIVAEVAIGWRDLDRTDPLRVHHAFRVASVTKPYTRALGLELHAAGLIDLDQQVFCTTESPEECVLDYTDTAPGPVNEDLSRVTGWHLLDHQAGWDRDQTFDPMFAPLLVQSELDLDTSSDAPTLPTPDDIVAWLSTQPVQWAPGTATVYSNVGYTTAGVAFETATSAEYFNLLRGFVFGPIARDTVTLGRSRPEDRRPDEVEYACDAGLAVNLSDPEGPNVCFADGGIHLEAMEAHGGLVAPARAVVEFLGDFCISGEPNTGECGDLWHDGSLPGTYAVARNLGRVSYVVLFNQRSDPEHRGGGYTDVVETIDAAIFELVDPFAPTE